MLLRTPIQRVNLQKPHRLSALADFLNIDKRGLKIGRCCAGGPSGIATPDRFMVWMPALQKERSSLLDVVGGHHGRAERLAQSRIREIFS